MAAQIAGVRASESRFSEEDRVCYDPYAHYFVSDEMRKSMEDLSNVKAAIAQYEQMMPGVNGAIVSRVRFIDEYFAECIADGIEQAVIIGAGFDTRAYRFDGLKDKVKAFEVDHPETQKVKVTIVKDIFGSLPKHVSYIPVIFGEERLDQKLMENGYNPKLKTLFILEGLIMYISPPAVDALLSFITNASAPGSSIVTDYFYSSVIDGTSPLKEAQVLRQFVEKEGSSLLFGIPEGGTEAFFTKRGFENVTDITTAECKERYFKGASKNRTVTPMFNFVHATVASKG